MFIMISTRMPSSRLLRISSRPYSSDKFHTPLLSRVLSAATQTHPNALMYRICTRAMGMSTRRKMGSPKAVLSTRNIGAEYYNSLVILNPIEFVASIAKLIPGIADLSQYISGVILNHETLYQKTADDKGFVDLLRDNNIIPGVKVDRGSVPIFGTEHEDTTEGFDGLQERCIQYKMEGCHFCKWRCTYKLSENRPSKLAVSENATTLAKYATIAQSARMVPILEPEILTTGEHDMPRALEVHEEVLSVLFRTLRKYHVFLEGMILKPAMVVAGIQNAKFCKPQIVADFTLTALRRTVPAAVPSIMFLSGGQSDEDATINLNAINQAEGKKPWILSFCYGRALQDKVMKTWKGNPENIPEAQSIFLQRVKQCSEASQGMLNVEEFEKCMRPPNDADDGE